MLHQNWIVLARYMPPRRKDRGHIFWTGDSRYLGINLTDHWVLYFKVRFWKR